LKIAVVGCGAMGSIYAALFAAVNHEVFVVDADASHVDAINTMGLRVTGASGDRTVKVQASTKPRSQTADLIIVAVKARHVESVIPAVTALLQSNSIVLTIQNGLGSAEPLADALTTNQLLIGVAQGFGASLTEPGVVHHNDMKAIRIGAQLDDYDDQSGLRISEQISKLWCQAGFDCTAEADIARVQWEKLICNAAYSGPCALTGLTVGEVLDHPHIGPISQAAATEAWQVARACGHNLSFDDPVQEVKQFAARMPAAKPSVLLDIEAGRKSEIDYINGAVPYQAAKVGLTAPVNATITGLVQTIEAHQ
jgi:2-dehydropantoate 2-reductase